MHIIDSNVLITAKNTYYPLDRVPEFWEWLVHQGQLGNIKIPEEIVEEIRDGNDDLAAWMRQDEVSDSLTLNENANIDLVRRVINDGYAPNLTDDELERLGRDPFIVAHALEDPDDITVVTTENSRPGRQRGNRHLPDVCNDLGVRCRNTFEMLEELDFRTGWNR
jgi:hypothetical protein